MYLRKLIPKFTVFLLVLLLSGLLAIGPAMAEEPPVEPLDVTAGISPTTLHNAGTDVASLTWEADGWTYPVAYMSISVRINGSTGPILLRQYSNDPGAPTSNWSAHGLSPATLPPVAGASPDPGITGSATWTIPSWVPAGHYVFYVTVWQQLPTGPIVDDIGGFFPFDINQAEGTLEIIKLDGQANPLSGWQFNVTGPVNRSGSTDSPGGNLTLKVPIGMYTATEVLKAGWVNTDPGGTAPYQKSTTVPFNDTATLYFVNVEDIGQIDIFKFWDKDGNGSYDGTDEPLSGWEYTISGVPGTHTTLGDGHVIVSDLQTGSYTVTETMQAGWTNTTSMSQTKQVNLGQTTDFEFGNWPTGSIDIFKYKENYEDLGGSPNSYDSGIDEPLSGWKFNVSGAPSNPYTTLAGGHVTVSNLVPGTYTVTEVNVPYAWANSEPGDYEYDNVVVTSGDTTYVEFGNHPIEIIVPTMGHWGIIALSGLLGLAVVGALVWRRRSSTISAN